MEGGHTPMSKDRNLEDRMCTYIQSLLSSTGKYILTYSHRLLTNRKAGLNANADLEQQDLLVQRRFYLTTPYKFPFPCRCRRQLDLFRQLIMFVPRYNKFPAYSKISSV